MKSSKASYLGWLLSASLVVYPALADPGTTRAEIVQGGEVANKFLGEVRANLPAEQTRMIERLDRTIGNIAENPAIAPQVLSVLDDFRVAEPQKAAGADMVALFGALFNVAEEDVKTAIQAPDPMQNATTQESVRLAIFEMEQESLKASRDAEELLAQGLAKQQQFFQRAGHSITVDEMPEDIVVANGTVEAVAALRVFRINQLIQNLAGLQLMIVSDGQAVPDGNFTTGDFGQILNRIHELLMKIQRANGALTFNDNAASNPFISDGQLINQDPNVLRQNISQWQAEIQTLLATPGLPAGEKLDQFRSQYFQTLIPAAKNISAKHKAFEAAQVSRDNTAMQNSEFIDQPTMSQLDASIVTPARRDLANALSASPVLSQTVTVGDFTGPLWQYLIDHPNADAAGLDAMNQAFIGMANDVRAEIIRLGSESQFSTLTKELGSGLYSTTRAEFANQLGESHPIYTQAVNGLPNLAQLYGLDEAQVQAQIDAALIGGQLLLALVTILFPPIAVYTVPAGLSLTATQVGVETSRYIDRASATEIAEGAFAAGGLNMAYVYHVQDIQSKQGVTLFFTAALGIVDVGLSSLAFRQALQARQMAAATKRTEQAIAAGWTDAPLGAGRTSAAGTLADTLADSTVAGVRMGQAVVSTIDPTTGRALAETIDISALAGGRAISPVPRVQALVSDLVDMDLVPRFTMTVGDDVFHFSRPFLGDEGRITYLMFTRNENGKMVVRYITESASGGNFRNVPGVHTYKNEAGVVMPGGYGKGIVGRTQQTGSVAYGFEDGVAALNELQGPLYRLANEVGFGDAVGAGALADLQKNILEDVLPEFIDMGRYVRNEPAGLFAPIGEFGSVAGRVGDTFVPGARGNLPTGGILFEWVYPAAHKHYAGATGLIVRTQDGSKTIHVIVEAGENGRILFPSIQDATSEITSFGVRVYTPDARSITMPGYEYFSQLTRAQQGMAGQPGWTIVPRGNNVFHPPLTLAGTNPYIRVADHATPYTPFIRNLLRHRNATAGQTGSAATATTQVRTPTLRLNVAAGDTLVASNARVPVLNASDTLVASNARAPFLNPFTSPGGSALLNGTRRGSLPGTARPSQLVWITGESAPRSGLAATAILRSFGLAGSQSDNAPTANVIQVPGGMTLQQFADQMGGNFPGLAVLQWDALRHKLIQTDDPHFNRSGSWGQSHDDQWAIKRAGLDSDFVPPPINGKRVVVAMIDTGLDWGHPDISMDSLWYNLDEIPNNRVDDDGNGYVDDYLGWNFVMENNTPWDFDGHGTMTSGIIAATRDNGIGIAGINPDVQLMTLKAVDNIGVSRSSQIAEAIMYAANNGADIINLSVGGVGSTEVEARAIAYAVERGVLIVVAAGNVAEDVENHGVANLDSVLTVAASDVDDARAAFSNFGRGVDLAAPGEQVLSLRARRTDVHASMAPDGYEWGDWAVGDHLIYSSGTSFSAPIVTGAASLIMQKYPNIEPTNVAQMLKQSATDIGTGGVDRLTGYGLVNVQAALNTSPGFFVDADISGASVAAINGAPHLQVNGTADADRFGKAQVQIGSGEAPTSWTTVASVDAKVRDSVLVTIPASAFSGSQTWTLRLVVDHADGTHREARFKLNLG